MREAARMDQGELATKAGIAARTLAKVEGNRGAVRLGTARKIGRVLGVEGRSLGTIARSSGR